VDHRELTGRWVHAREEDTDARMVFRADSVPLPPARGRLSFELRPDGTYVDSAYGADDRPATSGGSWRLQDDVLDLDGQAAQGVPRRMRVVEVGPDRLVVEP